MNFASVVKARKAIWREHKLMDSTWSSSYWLVYYDNIAKRDKLIGERVILSYLLNSTSLFLYPVQRFQFWVLIATEVVSVPRKSDHEIYMSFA